MTTAELAYRASSNGIDERNGLVLRELPQVYYVAARIHERLPKQVELEDLVQAGVIGLMEASGITTAQRTRNSRPLLNSEFAARFWTAFESSTGALEPCAERAVKLLRPSQSSNRNWGASRSKRKLRRT